MIVAHDWDDDDEELVGPRWLIWALAALTIAGMVETVRFAAALIAGWLG